MNKWTWLGLIAVIICISVAREQSGSDRLFQPKEQEEGYYRDAPVTNLAPPAPQPERFNPHNPYATLPTLSELPSLPGQQQTAFPQPAYPPPMPVYESPSPSRHIYDRPNDLLPGPSHVALPLPSRRIEIESDSDRESEFKYKSPMSGQKYKYDLSDPSDALNYKTDPSAQLNDSINPNVQIDRRTGYFGGGAE